MCDMPTRRKKNYQFIRTGVSYTEALPKEKWPMMESFLAELEHYARIAQMEKKKIDIWCFIREFRDIWKEGEERKGAF